MDLRKRGGEWGAVKGGVTVVGMYERRVNIKIKRIETKLANILNC